MRERLAERKAHQIRSACRGRVSAGTVGRRREGEVQRTEYLTETQKRVRRSENRRDRMADSAAGVGEKQNGGAASSQATLRPKR